MNFPQTFDFQTITSMDNYFLWQLPPMEFPQDNCPPGFRSLDNHPSSSFPLKNYWEMFPFESFSVWTLAYKESIANEDPRRGGTVTILKRTFSQSCLELISSGTSSWFTQQIFLTYLLKCDNVLVSYNVNIQWQSGNLAKMFEMPVNEYPGVCWIKWLKCPSTLMARVSWAPKFLEWLECQSASNTWVSCVPECLQCQNVWVLSECLQSTYRVPKCDKILDLCLSEKIIPSEMLC